MKYRVHLSGYAHNDIMALYEYIAANSSPRRADSVLSGIEGLYEVLAEFPMQGHFPPELYGHQSGDVRELRFKPYRIVYRIDVSRVVVLAVFDGRRDAQSLISERVLRSYK